MAVGWLYYRFSRLKEVGLDGLGGVSVCKEYTYKGERHVLDMGFVYTAFYYIYKASTNAEMYK